MAPQKMLYVRDEDLDLIAKAQSCSKENFSNTVIQALKFYVDSQEDVDFELQKLVIGFDPCVFDRDILRDYDIPEKFLYLLDELEDSDEDFECHKEDHIYDLKGDTVLDYLQTLFYETQITFFGKELASFSGKYPDRNAVYNLRGVKVSNELLEKAFAKDFSIPCSYETVSMKEFEDQDEGKTGEDLPWYGDIYASFKIFRTRGQKFLIWASTDSGDLNAIINDIGLIVPGASDYAILDDLKDDLTRIKTDNFGIEFELPPGLIQNAKRAFRTQKPSKHLDV